MEEDIKRDIVNYRRQKACDLMHDVDVLIDNELWNSAVNRMYYACFHMVSALLILHGIEVKSHMGVRQAFGLHFVKTNLLSSECGRIFSKIYDKRQSSDYDDFKDIENINFNLDLTNNLFPNKIISKASISSNLANLNLHDCVYDMKENLL